MSERQRRGKAQDKVEIQHGYLPRKIRIQYTMFAGKGKDLAPARGGSLSRFHNIFTITGPFGEKEVDSITFY